VKNQEQEKVNEEMRKDFPGLGEGIDGEAVVD
jgi:hypothetical protein